MPNKMNQKKSDLDETDRMKQGHSRDKLVNIKGEQEAQLSLGDRATRACQLKSCKLLRCTNVDDLHLKSSETDE